MRGFTLISAVTVVFLGCTQPASVEPRASSTSQAIIKGTPSANESVIQLAGRDVSGTNTYYKGCSGSLVAKNLVMTARHCVSEFNPTTAAVTSNFDASLFYVFASKDAPAHLKDGTAPAAQGKQLVLPESKSLLPDIAFIVLDRDVTSARVAALRLTAPPVKGEDLTLVGFGVTETGVADERRERKGVAILGVGPFDGVFHSAGEGEFMLGEGACFGDSGGAGFSTKTGAIVGVTSRVQNGKEETTAEPAAPCIGDTTEEIYTTVSAMKAVVDRAFLAAGAEPVLETADGAAESNGDALPTDQEQPSQRRQTPPLDPDPPAASEDSGCATTPRAPHGREGALGTTAAVVAAMLLARRRRRD